MRKNATLVALVAGSLAFGLVGCKKDKEVETDPAAAPAAPAGTAKVAEGAEVQDNAYHPERVAASLEPVMAEVGACFAGMETAKVLVNLVIDTDGSVGGAKLEKGTGNDDVDTCVSTALRKASFEAPRTGEKVTVKLPIEYTAQ